jgi:hypothetical protein
MKTCSKCGNDCAKRYVKGLCIVCWQKDYAKQWYKKHKKITKERAKEWSCKNRERRKEISRKSANRAYKLNPKKFIKRHALQLKGKVDFRIAHNMRSRIRYALKGVKKGLRMAEFLGCSMENFKKYIQSLFVDGMSWDNYGLAGWHIDHIKPCAKFDLTKPEEQKICFHYTNLQPLWAFDNQSKGGR